MIKLFRNIRQNLLNEGKTSKYFKYAIGEIVLVVIGILIALQVNNWNQTRKNDNEAHKALLSLRDDFQANLSNIKETTYRVNVMADCTSKLIRIIDRDSTSINPDSLGMYLTVGASSWWRVKTLSKTYDALAGAGNINLIQNENLSKLLAEFYSTIQSGFEDGSNLEQLALKILEQTSNETYVLWTNPRKDLKVAKKNDGTKQDALNSILNKKGIMGLLLFKNILEGNQQHYLNYLHTLSKDILNEIDKELD